MAANDARDRPRRSLIAQRRKEFGDPDDQDETRGSAWAGHPPTNDTPARKLYLLGQGKCPDCEAFLRSARGGGVCCNQCEAEYPVGRVPDE